MKLRPAATTSISTSLGLGPVRGDTAGTQRIQNSRPQHFDPKRSRSCSGRPTHSMHGARRIPAPAGAHISTRRAGRSRPRFRSTASSSSASELDLLARAGGEIDQPAMQVLIFIDRDPAQPPQRRLRHLKRVDPAVDRLRRTGDEPDAVDDEAVGRRDRLNELQRADAAQLRRRHERIARHRFGRFRVETPEMNDTCQVRRLPADARPSGASCHRNCRRGC